MQCGVHSYAPGPCHNCRGGQTTPMAECVDEQVLSGRPDRGDAVSALRPRRDSFDMIGWKVEDHHAA
jgi:hypothetical protein